MDDSTSGLNIEKVFVALAGSPKPERADLTQFRAVVLSVLGVPSYADLTAANVAMAASLPFYNIALSKLDLTTA
jgi:hypothetical protein